MMTLIPTQIAMSDFQCDRMLSPLSRSSILFLLPMPTVRIAIVVWLFHFTLHLHY